MDGFVKLTRIPELRFTAAGMPICKTRGLFLSKLPKCPEDFDVAVDEIDMVSFRGIAEKLTEHDIGSVLKVLTRENEYKYRDHETNEEVSIFNEIVNFIRPVKTAEYNK